MTPSEHAILLEALHRNAANNSREPLALMAVRIDSKAA